MKLADVTSINVHRTKTEMEEFNRVLGGGVVPGSLVLIGGDPGIGKSTLLLQVSTQLSQVGTVLYVSGEESAQQIKLRAERLGDIDSEFISMLRLICRACEQKWSASSLTSSSLTRSRLSCLLNSGFRDQSRQVREVNGVSSCSWPRPITSPSLSSVM